MGNEPAYESDARDETAETDMTETSYEERFTHIERQLETLSEKQDFLSEQFARESRQTAHRLNEVETNVTQRMHAFEENIVDRLGNIEKFLMKNA